MLAFILLMAFKTSSWMMVSRFLIMLVFDNVCRSSFSIWGFLVFFKKVPKSLAFLESVVRNLLLHRTTQTMPPSLELGESRNEPNNQVLLMFVDWLIVNAYWRKGGLLQVLLSIWIPIKR